MTLQQPLAQSIRRVHNPETYEALVCPHILRLRKWVKSKVSKGVDADDIVQQTLLLAMKNIGQFRHEASLGTWLCRIALNEIRGRLRSPQSWRTVFLDPQIIASWSVSDPLQSPEEALETKEVNGVLRRAMSRLPELYREVLELRDLRGLSIQETADSLSLSRPAVKSRHFRARVKLLEFYTDEQGSRRIRAKSVENCRA